MQVDSTVEELAWLIKDNLYAKHLVLSIEELFVDFLRSSLSGDEVLELKPMVSYQRMLLHRLADIFGLAHGSIGEGENRHIVVERCKDSSIPRVLVSDVLESSCGGLIEHETNPQLLKRGVSSDGEKTSSAQSSASFSSLEERWASYLAARERIFSEQSVSDENKGVEIERPRTVPVVARRMIAHALGRPISDNNSAATKAVKQKAEIPKSLCSCTRKDCDCDRLPRTKEHCPSLAAKRMFAQALGFSISSPGGDASGNSSLGGNNGRVLSVESVATSSSGNFVKLRSNAMSSNADICMSSKSAQRDIPGRTAQRMIAKALGLPSEGNRSRSFVC